MKLTKTEKQVRKMYRTELETMGGCMHADVISGTTIAVVSARAFDENHGAGGGDEDDKFFYVAASHCNREADEFNRKRGEFIALERLFDGEFVMVPGNGRGVREVMWDCFELMHPES